MISSSTESFKKQGLVLDFEFKDDKFNFTVPTDNETSIEIALAVNLKTNYG